MNAVYERKFLDGSYNGTESMNITSCKITEHSKVLKMKRSLNEVDIENSVYLSAKSVFSHFDTKDPVFDSFDQRTMKASFDKKTIRRNERLRKTSNLDNLFDHFLTNNIKIKQINGDNFTIPEFDESIFDLKYSKTKISHLNALNLPKKELTENLHQCVYHTKDLEPEAVITGKEEEKYLTFTKEPLIPKKTYKINYAANAIIQVPSDCN
jgi:hypothetical protein